MKQGSDFLKKIPSITSGLNWSKDECGNVTLEMQNKGIANRIAQLILRKPKISYIHLEEFGSFIWLQIDGTRDITAIGELVREQFGEKAEPLYERLSQYIKTLEANGFIIFNI